MRFLPALLSAGILLLAPAPPLGAQIHLQGMVVDEESGAALDGVLVELLDRFGQRVLDRTLSGADGSFRFTVRREGGYRFRAARMGYRRTTTPVLWTDGYGLFQLELRLDPEAVLLAPLEITARSRRLPSPVLEGFNARRTAGLGRYFTRDDIERLRPTYVTDLLARIPGVRLESSGRGSTRVIRMGRSASHDCQTQIFIDGMLLNRPHLIRGLGDPVPGFALDEAVSPDAVEGIEVYQGLASVPAEFLTPEARCGVVAVWTRRGSGRS